MTDEAQGKVLHDKKLRKEVKSLSKKHQEIN